MTQPSNVCLVPMSNCVAPSPDIISVFGSDIMCDVTDVVTESALQPTLQALMNAQCDEIYARNLQECNMTLFFVWAIFFILYLKEF